MKSDPCQYLSMVRDSCRRGWKGELDEVQAVAEATALETHGWHAVGSRTAAGRDTQHPSDTSCGCTHQHYVLTWRWTGRTEGGSRPRRPSLSRSTRECAVPCIEVWGMEIDARMPATV